MASTAAATPEYHDVIVVGGGIGGLYTAKLLQDQGISNDVIVLEGRQWLGGRVQTKRDENGQPIFNDFAWRVGDLDVNPLMHTVAKELGLTLIAQTTPPEDKAAAKTAIPSREILAQRAPLSDFARASLESASLADQQDRESGYAGRTAQVSWPNEGGHGGTNYLVKEGMSAYATKLAELLPEGCVRMKTRVDDVKRIVNDKSGSEKEVNYEVSAVYRTYTTTEPQTYHCKTVVLATPPYPLRSLSVAKNMLPALFAVHERRLGHLYVKVKDGTPNVPDEGDAPNRIYRNLPDSLLQQIISGDYGKHGAGAGYFQAAYACDRFERVWRELQFQGPSVMKEEAQKLLRRYTSDILDPQVVEAIEEVFLRIGFVHRWKAEAHVDGKTKKDLSLQAVHPNPVALPNLYLVGEAFSPFQGWTEGALWTAQEAVQMMAAARNGDDSKAKHSAFLQPLDLVQDDQGVLSGSPIPDILVYRGHVIPGQDFVGRHPGGPHPIKGFMNRDMSEFFDGLHGGWPEPLATLFGLQVGTAKITASTKEE